MRQTVCLNPVEPSRLALRWPRGVNLDLVLLFEDLAGVPTDPTPLRGQLVVIPRSRGGVYSYDVQAYDAVNGLGVVQIPGVALGDSRGYSLELYKRMEPLAPGDPLIPTEMIAFGELQMSGLGYKAPGPFGAISVPVVIGPPGAQGIPGAQGEPGTPGSVWTTGDGDPVGDGVTAGDMYLDNLTGNVWRWSGAAWLMG